MNCNKEEHNDYISGCVFCEIDDSAIRERERIIKLLEEHTHLEAESEYLIDCDLCERYYGVGVALALIKGEQK